MYALNFQYDSQYLSDYGFIICNFDYSSGSNVEDTMVDTTVNTVSFNHGAKHNIIYTGYDDCITMTFDICKNPDEFDDMRISQSEFRKISKWLNRKEFLKFKLIDDEAIEDYCLYATFNISPIKINEQIYGIRLSMQTNAPFAYHNPISFTIESSSSNWTKTITSLSDEEGYIYPEMEITINENGTFELYNELENRTMSIDGCTAGEIIKINYPMIESNIPSHKIQNDFNWQFFRISNSYKNKENKLNISLPCAIKMTYTPIIKIGI